MATFRDEVIQQVWDNLEPLSGVNPNLWKKDFAGAWIKRDCYGLTNEYGWEIDHIQPLSQNGSNNLDNLEAVHWRNNRHKADNYPEFESIVTSEGIRNVIAIKSWVCR